MTLKIVLLAFLLAYIVLRIGLAERLRSWRPWLDRAGATMAVLAVLSLTNFGHFVRGEFINDHDVYHYYFGAKYAPEHKYLELYQCSFQALKEAKPTATARVTSIRDLRNNRHIRKKKVLANPAPCREMFGETRWAQFKRDLRAYDRAFKPRWRKLLRDKGYNATPLWDTIGRHIANLIPAGRKMVALACIDIGLLALSFILVFEAFGPKGLVVGLLILGGGFELAHTHIRNGFLRLDWLAALFGVVSLLRLKRPAWAGALLAYSAAIRVFPVLFVLGPGLWLVLHFYRHRTFPRPALRAAISFTAVSFVLLGLSFAEPGSLDRFGSFVEKIDAHRKDISTTRVGLDYALVYEGEMSAEHMVGVNGERGFRPHFVRRKQNRKSTMAPVKYGLTLGFVLVVAFFLWRRPEGDPDELLLESLLCGFPMVYLLLNPTFYYYVYLAPFVLGFAMLRRPRLLSLGTSSLLVVLGIVSFVIESSYRFDYVRHFGLSVAIGVTILLFGATLVHLARAQRPEGSGRTIKIRASVVVAITLAVGVVGAGVYFAVIRKPAPEPPAGPTRVFAGDSDEVTLLFGGDTSFARGIGRVIADHGDDLDFPLSRIAPRLHQADFVFLNLECALSDNTSYMARKRWLLHAPTAVAPALAKAGVDLVSVANNHALDLGEAGFADTLRTLESIQVLATGVEWRKRRQIPTVAQIGRSTFAFLGYSAKGYGSPNGFFPRPHSFKLSDVLEDIAEAKKAADHVVVSLHRGDEYMMTPHDRHRRDARAMVDAGAELVIAHHPHVPQPVERYNGGVIAHSLGNFLFDMTSRYKRQRTRRGFMLEVRYKGGALADVKLVPTNVDETFRPYVDDTLDMASWMLPSDDAPRLSAQLRRAVVTRGGERCGKWSRKPPKRRGQYMEWLRGRWVCDQDKRKPYLTVAPTGERSQTVFERGVWAQPQPGSTLSVAFAPTPLGQTLSVVAGVPDFAHVLAQRSKRAVEPVQLRVAIDGMEPGPQATRSIAFEPGWHRFEIDTSALAGEARRVTVELEGGTVDESGFLFDVALN